MLIAPSLSEVHPPRGQGPQYKTSLRRDPVAWTVWFSFVLAVYREVVGHNTIVYIGGFNLTIAEPMFAMGAISAFLMLWRRPPRPTILRLLIWLFCAILALNLARGMAENANAAIISLRATGALWLFFIISTAYDPEQRLAKWSTSAVTAAAAALSLLVVARTIVGPQLFMQIAVSADLINDGGRPLSALGALIIAAASTLLFSHLIRRGTPLASWRGLSLAFLIGALLLTGQGTATVCGAVGMIVVFVLERGRARLLRLSTLALLIPLIVILAATPSLFDPTSWVGILPDEVISNFFRREANIGTRRLVWDGILAAYGHAGALEKLFGWPAGTAPLVIVQSPHWGTVAWSASAHSMYFGTLMSHGAVGLGLYAGIVISAALTGIKKLGHVPTAAGGWTASGALAILSICGVFGYSYNISAEAGLLLGASIAALAGRTWAKDQPPLPADATPRWRDHRVRTVSPRS